MNIIISLTFFIVLANSQQISDDEFLENVKILYKSSGKISYGYKPSYYSKTKNDNSNTYIFLDSYYPNVYYESNSEETDKLIMISIMIALLFLDGVVFVIYSFKFVHTILIYGFVDFAILNILSFCIIIAFVIALVICVILLKLEESKNKLD